MDGLWQGCVGLGLSRSLGNVKHSDMLIIIIHSILLYILGFGNDSLILNASFLLLQVNFLFCQFASLGLGYIFRTQYGPEKTTPTVRHCIQIAIGIPMAYFCFGMCVLLFKFHLIRIISHMCICLPGICTQR